MMLTKNLKRINWKTLFLLLLFAWFALNILQAIFTEIIDDESYYAFWGEHLAWGYYDHPPLVGVMTHLSALLFSGNLSVRFLTVLAQIFTLCLIWRLCEEKMPSAKKVLLFFVFPATMIMFSVYGFITTPDVPLLFFTALFLLIYQRFLKEESWTNTLLLGVSMAGMMYSKYHAVLIIGLIVVSNFRLLSRYKFWLAGILAVVLLIPHLLWHIKMDFPSFQYHLSARSSGFKWKYIFEYLPNQLVVFNPLVVGAIFYILFKYKPRDIFERGLYALIIGFFTFFALMTFRGHVEPHWTVICSIPMIILLYRYSLQNKKLLRFVKYGIAPLMVLIFITRILFATDNSLTQRLDFAGKTTRFKALESIAGDKPVVFTGSFQKPSLYHFFTRKETTVLSAVNSRQTQFDIWQKELDWQGKPVFICSEVRGLTQEYNVGIYKFHGFFCDNFQSVNRLKITYELDQVAYSAGDTLYIHFEIFNPQPNEINFRHPELPVTLKTVYFDKNTPLFRHCEWINPVEKLPPHTSIKGMLKTVIPDLQGVYKFGLTLDNKLCFAANSAFVRLQIN
ncbi:MAG: glycosyltransferase family 39 protein [Bacteroidetes bacterium]|nr:glycosyltransferase family 39 protein [Bacteroidota bacterium]MCL2303301.1 glycosyltransferase family 39 protein [Lentimicrobiaceae bacterium]